jgi:trans-2,3-dihydro-3-hydroxyanthranilate isomerase
MRTYKIHHIDSFTNQLFGGNPTVTVLNADSLTEQEMKKIAREMNLSETGFILPSKKAD